MTTRRRCVCTDSPGQTVYANTVGPCSHSDTHAHIHTHEVSGCVPDATEDSHKRWSGLQHLCVRSHLKHSCVYVGEALEIESNSHVFMINRSTFILRGYMVKLVHIYCF